MILNGATIKSRQLVKNDTAQRYRGASYDLTIGDIVDPEGKITGEYVLLPQGMIKVISAETVSLSSDITGCVHVKTNLCNEGVLALNIGIVDPDFSGPLQSTLINFGKARHSLKRGDVFGRITFHEQMASSVSPPLARTIDVVRSDAQKHVLNYLAPDFLDFSKTVEKVAEKTTSEYKTILVKYVPLGALLLAGLTYFLNFSNMSRMESYLDVKDRVVDIQQRDNMNRQIEELQQTQLELKGALAALDETLRKLQEAPSADAQTPAKQK